MAHVTGHDELPPREDPTPEHPTDFVSKLTWNEYYHHFSRQLLEQFKWEITVLGFLALIVYFCHKGFFDIVAGGRDMRWGAQTHGQVFIAVEDAHFSLFSAVVCYFASLAFILTMTLKLMAPHIQHERALALQRAKDRDVEITTNAAGAACPVGELEKVLAVGGGERPGKAAETYRDVRYGLIEFLKKKGLPAHRPRMRIDDGVGSFDDGFHFALYLRANYEAMVVDFIEVKPTTWLCFMTILSFFIVCARFEVFGQLTSYVPAIFFCVLQLFVFAYSMYRVRSYAGKSRRRRERKEANREADKGDELEDAHVHDLDHKGKKVRSRFSGETEVVLIHLYQAWLLMAMIYVGTVLICVEIEILRRVRAESSRRWRGDAGSTPLDRARTAASEGVLKRSIIVEK